MSSNAFVIALQAGNVVVDGSELQEALWQYDRSNRIGFGARPEDPVTVTCTFNDTATLQTARTLQATVCAVLHQHEAQHVLLRIAPSPRDHLATFAQLTPYREYLLTQWQGGSCEPAPHMATLIPSHDVLPEAEDPGTALQLMLCLAQGVSLAAS